MISTGEDRTGLVSFVINAGDRLVLRYATSVLTGFSGKAWFKHIPETLNLPNFTESCLKTARKKQFLKQLKVLVQRLSIHLRLSQGIKHSS